uniref:UGGT thioredoxin-like domain-containing protein n=1 Tax=Ditylenchus dipsaci TaxID=166011 RepID=A0A915CVM7_9BILA
MWNVWALLVLLTLNSREVFSVEQQKLVKTSLDANGATLRFWQKPVNLSLLKSQNWSVASHEEEYNYSIKQAATYLSNARLDLLKFALSLRLYSPKLQVFQQIAEEFPNTQSKCLAFVDLNGEVTCQLGEIDDLLKSAGSRDRSDTHQIDHFYGSSSKLENQLPLAVLYADLGSKEFSLFHNKLKGLADVGSLNYIFRHFQQKSDESCPVGLSGYGVELAIKNTEYKAIDDSNVDKNSQDDNEQADNDVNGLNFNVLKKNYEHLKEPLNQFKIHLSDMEELAL